MNCLGESLPITQIETSDHTAAVVAGRQVLPPNREELELLRCLGIHYLSARDLITALVEIEARGATKRSD
jgi:hypothetical protein